MQLNCDAILCALRPHGEHGVIARCLTAEAGLLPGYVRGGRSRRMKPILIPGNVLAADFRARTTEQMPSLTAELAHSRGALLNEPLPAAAIDWVTTLTAAALPEGQSYPQLYTALSAVLDAIELGGVARRWAIGVVRFESLMLEALGYGTPGDATQDLRQALARNGRALDDHVLNGPRMQGAADTRERMITRMLRGIA